MLQVFAHDAILEMDVDADLRAPGGAITVELCGGWDHDPPCPLAPHHTTSTRDGSAVVLRILFAVEEKRAAEVRDKIDRALSGSTASQPGGITTGWTVRRSQPGVVTAAERDHAGRLMADPA